MTPGPAKPEPTTAFSLNYNLFREALEQRQVNWQELLALYYSASVALARVQAEAARYRAALRAQELLDRGKPNPFGHDCRWCSLCIVRVAMMRQAALDGGRRCPALT